MLLYTVPAIATETSTCQKVGELEYLAFTGRSVGFTKEEVRKELNKQYKNQPNVRKYIDIVLSDIYSFTQKEIVTFGKKQSTLKETLIERGINLCKN